MNKIYQTYQNNRFRFLLWTGLVIASLMMLPYLLLGQGSIITYHDQLDGELFSYILSAKYLFSGADVYPEIMHGLPATGAVPPAPLFVLFYLVLKPFGAFLCSQWCINVVGFLGMYLLLHKLTLGKHDVISFWIAILFMMLPFYPVYGLCIPGQPLLFYAVLCLWELYAGMPGKITSYASKSAFGKASSAGKVSSARKASFFGRLIFSRQAIGYYLLIVLYGACSSLVLVGFAVLLLLGCASVICSLRQKLNSSSQDDIANSKKLSKAQSDSECLSQAKPNLEHSSKAQTTSRQKLNFEVQQKFKKKRGTPALGLWVNTLLLLLTYLVTNFTLLLQVFFPGQAYVSHKTEMVLSPQNVKDSFLEAFTTGIAYTQSYHKIIIVVVLALVVVYMVRLVSLHTRRHSVVPDSTSGISNDCGGSQDDFISSNEFTDHPASSYSVANEVADAPASNYSVANEVADAPASNYSVANEVADAPASNYTVDNEVADAPASSYSVANEVADAPASNYSVANEVADAPASSYSVANEVTDAPASNYTVANEVADAPASNSKVTETSSELIDFQQLSVEKSLRHFRPVLYLLTFIILISVCYALYHGTAITALRNSSTGVLKTFNLDRIAWLLPVSWCVLAAYCLCYILEDLQGLPLFFRRALLVAVLGLWGVTILLNSSLRPNLSKLVKENLRHQDYYALDWQSFFAEDVFAQIDAAIGEPKESYHIVSLGIYPAAAAYNGFYCLDGYSNNYPVEYKHTFGKIMEGEMSKSEYVHDFFWNWGNRCYITTAEQANYYTFEKKWNSVIYDLQLDMDTLKSLDCKYIFSAAYLMNADDLGLSLLQEAPFETEESWYHIYVYEIL